MSLLTFWRRTPVKATNLYPTDLWGPEPSDRDRAFIADKVQEMASKDKWIGQLEMELASLRGRLSTALQRAATAELTLRELSVACAGDAAANELIHARRTLLDYEDQLKTCRDKHGTNTRSGWPPPAHPGVPR